jgi:hypothetical protein
MSYEERGTWVYLFVSLGVYAAYVIVVLSRAVDPITETAYQVPLLWSIGAAILASIVLRIVVEIGAGVARGVADEVAKKLVRGPGERPSIHFGSTPATARSTGLATSAPGSS